MKATNLANQTKEPNPMDYPPGVGYDVYLADRIAWKDSHPEELPPMPPLLSLRGWLERQGLAIDDVMIVNVGDDEEAGYANGLAKVGSVNVGRVRGRMVIFIQ